MITTITLIRHPESEINIRAHEVIGGRSNAVGVSDKGMRQVAALQRRFAAERPLFDVMYTSPATRTKILADALLTVLPNRPPLVVADAIQEIDQGDWEGKPRREYHTPDVIQKIIAMKGHHKAPNGESAIECGQRGFLFAENCRDIHAGQHVAWVTHGYLIKATLAQIQQSDPSLTHFTEIDNTSITVFKYHHSKESWGVARVNDVAHLTFV